MKAYGLFLGNTYYFFLNSEKFTAEPRLVLGIARIYDMLNDQENAIDHYKKVLVLDSSNIEAIASLGAHLFYSDQVRIFYLVIKHFIP